MNVQPYPICTVTYYAPPSGSLYPQSSILTPSYLPLTPNGLLPNPASLLPSLPPGLPPMPLYPSFPIFPPLPPIPNHASPWPQLSKASSGFSLLQAAGHLLKGTILGPLQSLFSLNGLVTVGGCAALSYLFRSKLTPWLLGASVISGGLQLAKGLFHALGGFFSDQPQRAEGAFEHIGAGLALGLAGLLGYKSGLFGKSSATLISAKAATAFKNTLPASLRHAAKMVQKHRTLPPSSDLTLNSLFKSFAGVFRPTNP